MLPFINNQTTAGKLIQQINWQTTTLGNPENWPQSLRTSLSILLPAPIPMLLIWGEESICFYNDEFLFHFKNETNLSIQIGDEASKCLPEKLQFLASAIKNVLTGKETSHQEKLYKSLDNTLPENTYWTFNINPVFNDITLPAGVLITAVKSTIAVDAFTSNYYQLAENKIIESLERKDAEAKAVIENTMFPIALIGANNMEILIANNSIIKIWGKGKNVIGKKFTELLPEFEAQQVFEKFKEVINSGETYSAENQRIEIIKNGQTSSEYFNYSFVPLKDENGKIYAILNTAVDITEVTEAKLKVEKSLSELKLFKFMADHAADKLILIRKDASFAYVNKKVLSKWGYTNNEIKRLSVFDVDTLYQKNDFDKLFEKSFEKNAIQFETNHKNKMGEVFPVEVSSTGFELEGESFIFVIARDITERKKADLQLRNAFGIIEDSEKRFRESVKQAPFGIAIFKGENFIAEMANDDYYKIIDRTEEQFLNRPIFEALPEIKEDIEPTFKEVYKTGKTYYKYELPAYIKKTNGLKLCYFNLVYHPIMDVNGSCSGIMVVAVDITENVNAKNKLQESEKQFRNVIMQSPVAIIILRGEAFMVETANKVMLEKIMERSEKEVLGKPILELFPELLKQQYPEILKDVYNKGKNLNIEEAKLFVNRGAVVQKMVLDLSFTSMAPTETTAAGIMVTANIVTEKVEARRNVEHSNERLRLATEAANMGTWELDIINKELIHSPQLAKIFGEEGNNKIDFQTLRNKFLQKDLEELVRPAFEQATQTGFYFYEARIMKAPDAINWIRTQGKVVFDDNKQPLKMMGTTVDITEAKLFTEELKKSEERFRLLANEVPQLIWTADPQGKIFYFNESVFSYSGKSKEDLSKDGWLVIVHPEDKSENVRLWKEAIKNGTDFIFEHRFRRYDGVYRWQLSRAIPQRNEMGEIQAWVGSSTDIQNIKEQEQQKDFFISMASHELKTPVTSIKGYVQILQSLYENTEDKFLKESLNVVDKQIITLTKLITELLDISKIKSGGLDIKKESFEVGHLIEEVIQQIQHTTPHIEINFYPDKETIVYADKDRIGQVLINLFTNAIKYTPKAKAIEVFSKLTEGWITISIKDEGIGISKTNQHKIFERFYRVEGKDEQTYPGFGIGLFIASEIINKHNGTMQVTSELGKGSVFSFTLPL